MWCKTCGNAIYKTNVTVSGWAHNQFAEHESVPVKRRPKQVVPLPDLNKVRPEAKAAEEDDWDGWNPYYSPAPV